MWFKRKNKTVEETFKESNLQVDINYQVDSPFNTKSPGNYTIADDYTDTYY